MPALPADEEYVLEYALPLPGNLPPREFILKMFVWTQTDGNFNHLMVFNEVSGAGRPALLLTRCCDRVLTSPRPPNCRPSPCLRSPSSWTPSS